MPRGVLTCPNPAFSGGGDLFSPSPPKYLWTRDRRVALGTGALSLAHMSPSSPPAPPRRRRKVPAGTAAVPTGSTSPSPTPPQSPQGRGPAPRLVAFALRATGELRPAWQAAQPPAAHEGPGFGSFPKCPSDARGRWGFLGGDGCIKRRRLGAVHATHMPSPQKHARLALPFQKGSLLAKEHSSWCLCQHPLRWGPGGTGQGGRAG